MPGDFNLYKEFEIPTLDKDNLITTTSFEEICIFL